MSHIQNDVLFMGTADKTVTNTTTETSGIPTGVGSTSLQADWWEVGKSLRLKAYGVYSTPAITGGTVTIKVKLGSTVIATVATSSLLIGASSAAFHFEVTITCRSVGASGSVICGGAVDYEVASAARVFDNLDNDGATTTVDTTTAAAVDVTITWDTASVSKIVKTTLATMEIFSV